MAHEDIEIEIKFPLKNAETVIAFLNAHAEGKGEKRQLDTYFTPEHRDFLAEQYPFEWLRIREGKANSINYKHFFPEGAEKTTHCNEFETVIEDAEKLKKLFAALDMKEIVVVDKTRKTWMYKDVELALDEVKDLGTYIELECMKKMEPEEGKKYLYKLLKEIGAEVGEEDLRGYPFALLGKQFSP